MPTATDLLGTTSALVKDIEIIRGDDKVINITWIYCSTRLPYDWTGWDFAARIRDDVDGTIWADAVVTHDGTGGKITILFSRTDTVGFTPGDVGKWDLQGTDPAGLVRTILRGGVTVVGDIT